MGQPLRTKLAVVDGAAVAVCLLAAILTLTGMHGGLRAYVVVAAAVLGPGWSLAGWLPHRSTSFSVTLALAMGVAILILVGMVCVGLHWWHPVGTLAVLLVISACTAAALVPSHLRRAEA